MSNLTVFKAETKKDAEKEIRPRLSTIVLTIIVVAVAFSLVTAIYFANVSYSSEKSFSKTYAICKEKILGFERMGAYDTTEKLKAALSYC
jgi:hypothetical protein